MSLLMDALRKAEESKKQVEQGGKSTSSDSGLDIHLEFSLDQSAPDQGVKFTQGEPAQETVTIEGEPIVAEPAHSQAAAAEDAPSSSQDSSDSKDLSLADIAARFGRTGEPAPSESAKGEAEAPVEPAPPPAASAMHMEESAKPPAARLTAEKYADRMKKLAALRAGERRANARKAAQKPAHEQANIKKQEAGTDGAATPAKKEGAPPKHRREPTFRIDEAITEAELRTPLFEEETREITRESDQDNARSLFLAKRQRTLPVAATGVALVLVLLLGGGSWYYLSRDQGAGFDLPASAAVNNPILREPEPVIESAAPAAAPTAPSLDTAPLDAPEPSALESGAVISQVIGVDPEPLPAVAEESLLESVADGIADISGALADSLSDLADGEAQAAAAEQGLPDVLGSDATGVASAAMLEPTNLISFSRREAVSAIDPVAARAYSAYQAGDLEQARLLYQQVLATTPYHRDALLGMAAIAVRGNEPVAAMELYARLLARDPGDPVARAGMLDLTPSGSPSDQERSLKRLRELHPQVAPLAYALGNFYASQRRWNEAQQSYFSALQLAKAAAAPGDSVNPDYAYNLAVSLEHLNQPLPAANFYLEAVDLAASHTASFDAEEARNRVPAVLGDMDVRCGPAPDYCYRP